MRKINLADIFCFFLRKHILIYKENKVNKYRQLSKYFCNNNNNKAIYIKCFLVVLRKSFEEAENLAPWVAEEMENEDRQEKMK